MMRFEQELFGSMTDYHLWTDTEPELVNVGDKVTLIDGSEGNYDNIKGCFEENLLYCIICDLNFLESDLSEYSLEKSKDNSGHAYATATIKQIKEITY